MKVTNKVTLGLTPHGGVKTIAYFYDENHNPCTEEEASFINFSELDEQGNQVFSLFAMTKKGIEKNVSIFEEEMKPICVR